MGISRVYPTELESLYPDETDDYIQGMVPIEDASGDKFPISIGPRLQSLRDALRTIEVQRRLIVGQVSILATTDLEVIAALPPDQQLEIEDWISRIAAVD